MLKTVMFFQGAFKSAATAATGSTENQARMAAKASS
jgi:hypothetical protein